MSQQDYNNRRKLSFLGFNPRQTDNGDPNEVQLDEEMEKVFAGSDREKEKFSVLQLAGSADEKPQPSPVSGKFLDPDHDQHRNEPYPHKLSPSKPSRSMKRQDSKDTNSQDEDKAESARRTPTVIPYNRALPLSSPTRSLGSGSGESDHAPQISERAAALKRDHDDDDEEKRIKVKFEGSQGDTDEAPDEKDEHGRRRKSRHQHYKQRKHSLSDKQTGGVPESGGRRVSVQPEDATLDRGKRGKEADIDELTSHRSDDPRGMRRHKIQPSSQSARKDSTTVPMGKPPTGKKTIDHSPHDVFVQLDELVGHGEEAEWKETARWIKYEEDVEEGSDRWGRPHVASLSFHSLLNLRRCLETGVVLMDLEEKDLPGVAYRVVEQMVVEDLIQADDKATVLRALLLRHRHVNESHSGFHFGSRRKYSSYTSLQSLWIQEELGTLGVKNGCPRRPFSPPTATTDGSIPRRHSTLSYLLFNLSEDKKPKIVPAGEINGFGGNDTKIDIKEEVYSSSQEDLVRKAQNDTILRRIPQGAEATTVLVGAVDFLEQPTIAFVRLAEGITMPSITEVPIPVRFLFILLGPKNIELDYHEIGRSIATLMSNTHFHDIAYKADDRKDLLSAINEFLDDSIVLPPGNWERQELLPIEELKAKSERIRNRKVKAMQEKNKDKQQLIADEEKRLLAAAEGDPGGRKPTGPLEKTGRWWGGVINDMKRRLPMYKSDITDGLNTETLAASLFMYFAALSTAITFGGLASDKTHNLIGISETLISQSIAGIFFHAVCGQPLVIIGTTGPLLLFDEALYEFCKANGFEFLTMRVWVGLWQIVIALVVSAFEGSVYVRLFTRFTQEIFSALITLIYLVETAMKLVKVYKRHPLYAEYNFKNVTPPVPPEPVSTVVSYLTGNDTEDPTEVTTILTTIAEEVSNIATTIQENVTSAITTTLTTPQTQEIAAVSDNSTLLPPFDDLGPLNQPNTALFCTILTLGTFTLAYYLRIFRNSHFLGRTARRALGDFGVPVSIAIFVAVDFMIPQVFTDKLSVPEGISPSDPENRGWVIPWGPVPMWVPFASVIPALLVYILIFMETHISELIVDKPERGLKKGSGLHMDIVLLSICNTVCSFFGMPWHCAATVRSVTHVSSVTIMSRTHAPGDKPHIVDVKEQRLSGLFVSVMVGLSVAMAPILRLIPMSVLFGVFLYMGIVSMVGVHFFERLKLFFMPVKYHPSEPFVRRVPTWKMHIFTFTQAAALAILWGVKSSSFSLAFPFFLIMMVPLRHKLATYFTASELNALDGNKPDVDPDNEPDFYEQAGMPS
ncbi:band 3 anion transport protein isoform X5 [Phlebotomus papatasi]|uniref:band 3 anion transport protein isoform X5 n=1 Tax=Phlebotomus papatasi TaxID=29031 RepID=UPI0024836B1D|nr:band 3 anion transport protein isoform X5 [Phlebotomus papatasi]